MPDAPLTVHRDSRPDAVTRGRFRVERWGSRLSLTYWFACRRTEIVLPEPQGVKDRLGLYAPVRADELWRSTCFELFVRPVGIGTAYCEYNFSPAMRWAGYRFADRRLGMRNLKMEPPQIWASMSTGDYHYCAVFDVDSAWAERRLRLAASAVIEEKSGTKSYWALKHGDGPPDFHDPESATFEVAPEDHA